MFEIINSSFKIGAKIFIFLAFPFISIIISLEINLLSFPCISLLFPGNSIVSTVLIIKLFLSLSFIKDFNFSFASNNDSKSKSFISIFSI